MELIYKDGKFLIDDKLVNPEHADFTLMDFCETLCFCPFTIYGMQTRQIRLEPVLNDNDDFAGEYNILVENTEIGQSLNTITGNQNTDGGILHLFDLFKEFKLVDTRVSSIAHDGIFSVLFANRYVISVSLDFGSHDFSWFSFDLIVDLRPERGFEIDDDKIFGPVYFDSLDWRFNNYYGVSHGSAMARGLAQAFRIKLIRELFDKLGVTEQLKAEIVMISF